MRRFPTVRAALALAAFLAAVASAVASAAGPAAAQEVQDVLAKMIEAQGGREALAGVQTTTAKGEVDLLRLGMSGRLTLSQKEPDKMRLDIELSGLVVTQAFDGLLAWMSDPQGGTSQAMPEALARSMKRQAVGSAALLDPGKAGIAYALRGLEKAGGRDCHVLEQSFADGAKAVLLVDVQTGHILRSRARIQDPVSGGDVDAETVYEDYRRVGPMMVAHKVTVWQAGIESMRMVFSQVEINAALDDDYFRMVK